MNVPAETPSEIYPSLAYDDAPAAIDWLCRVFGFEKKLVVPGPDGSIMHSELAFRGAVVMISTSRAEERHVSPRQLKGTMSGLSLRIDDPDAHYARTKAAGGKITRDLQNEDYGSRGYMAEDPEGHRWYFGTYRPGAHWKQ